MSKLHIKFDNPWDALTITLVNDAEQRFVPETHDIASWSGRSYTSESTDVGYFDIAFVNATETMLNFNIDYFIEMLNKEQKKLLLEYISHDIGFNDSRDIIHKYEIDMAHYPADPDEGYPVIFHEDK